MLVSSNSVQKLFLAALIKKSCLFLFCVSSGYENSATVIWKDVAIIIIQQTMIFVCGHH